MFSSEGCSGVYLKIWLILRGIRFFLCADLTRLSLAVVSAVHGCQNVFPDRSSARIKNTGVVIRSHIVVVTLIVVLVVRGITCYSVIALCERCSTWRRKRLLSSCARGTAPTESNYRIRSETANNQDHNKGDKDKMRADNDTGILSPGGGMVRENILIAMYCGDYD